MSSQWKLRCLKLKVKTCSKIFLERLETIVNKAFIRSLSINIDDLEQEALDLLLKVFMQIPPNSLQELSLKNVDIEEFKIFLVQQTLITKLHINVSIEDPTIISNLNLTSLKLAGPMSKTLESIIESQPNLIKLHLSNVEQFLDNDEDDDNHIELILDKVIKLHFLESLKISVKVFSVETISTLSGLKRLTKLSVACSESHFEAFPGLILSAVKELEVIIARPARCDFIDNLAENIPNLKSFKLKGPLVTSFLHKIVQNFKNLESLWVENSESSFVQVLELPPMTRFNLKLKHLTIINPNKSKVVICSNIMTSLIKFFRKLETLVITKNISTHFYNVEFLMKELKLKEIVLDLRGEEAIPKLLQAFKDHGKCLHFILLKNFKGDPDVERIHSYFNGKFPVVEFKDGNLIIRKKGEKIYSNKTNCY